MINQSQVLVAQNQIGKTVVVQIMSESTVWQARLLACIITLQRKKH